LQFRHDQTYLAEPQAFRPTLTPLEGGGIYSLPFKGRGMLSS